MKRTALGLAAVFVAALLPFTVLAASKKDEAANNAKSHATGMAEGPPLAKQLALPCTATDADFVQGTQKGADGKATPTKIYELVCQEGLGYVIFAPEGGMPAGIDCLALADNKPQNGQPAKGGLYCKLPANEDPVKGFSGVMTKAGVNCTPSKGRYVGSAASPPLEEYEIYCSDDRDFLVQLPRVGSTAPLLVDDCVRAKEGLCTFFPHDKVLATLSTWAAPAGRTSCQISDARYMGTSTTNKNSFYEIACAGGQPGYVLQLDPSNKYVAAIDCSRAAGVGGCSMTAATADIATYAKAVKAVGVPCALKGYRSVGVDSTTNREIVEISCSDHPDGGFALLPVGAGKGEFYNCARAEIRKLQCTLTTPDATNGKLTQQITSLHESCKVTRYRPMTLGTSTSDFVEVACAGEPGWVIEYTQGVIPEAPKSVLACSTAKSLGGCELK